MASTTIDMRLPAGTTSAATTYSNTTVVEGRKPTLFAQALDAVNPLQHVPGVSQAYRAVTGDKISETSKIVGHLGLGAAVAGPVGLAVGAGVYLVEKIFGGLFGGSKGDTATATATPPLTSTAGATAGKVATTAGGSQNAAAAVAAAGATVTGTTSGGTGAGVAPVSMSSAQFTALLTAFGQGAEDEQTRKAAQVGADAASGQVGSDDFANRMAANLDKLQSLKKAEVAQ